MSALVLAAILVSAVIIATKGEDVFDTLPFTACCAILTLYILAFFHALPFAGWICGAGVIALGVILVKRARTQEKVPVPDTVRQRILDPQFLLALAIITTAAILAADRVVTWWDDINFWANDAKYLWAAGGFAGKYGNVSPEFGDYPPAMALWKWIFLSLSPHVYQEGLQFSAYHVLNLLLLLPLLKKTRQFTHLIPRLIAVPAVLLLPSAVCALQFGGTAADIPMGILYGALLLTIREAGKSEGSSFVHARITVYASVLVLIKSSGFYWAILALAYALWVQRRPEKPENLKSARLTRLIPAILPILTWGTWLIYCLANRRIAKLTSEAVNFAGGRRAVATDIGERLRVYLEAFFLWPLHEDRQITLDPSAGGMIGTLIISCVILRCFITHSQAKLLNRATVFFTVTALTTYGAIRAAHLTIFQTEEQYSDPFIMARSISRYGAPWMLGALMIVLDRVAMAAANKSTAAIAIFLILPLLTAGYAGEARAFVTYRESRETDLAIREETIDPEGRAFLKYLADHPEAADAGRILFLRDPDLNHTVKDIYISYEACPTPVVYADYQPGMTEDEIRAMQNMYHASEVWYQAE
ncbi:MAG: hypothetical protein K6B72_07325 [Lachnospiraceae bacterium]|nr:hypothetical protein [Lachnospiraceae bacterium]